MINSDNYQYKHQLTWDDKAKANPLYAIMSDDFLKNSSTDMNEEELEKFYLQGKLFWRKWFAPLFPLREDLKDLTIIEYGVGMARLLNQPASQGANCIGIDISEQQINNAKIYCPNANKIEFKLLIPKKELNIQNESGDLVYSYAVLQHIKLTSDVIFAIKEMCRITKKNGYLKFQVRGISRNKKDGIYKYITSFTFDNFTISFYLRRTFFFFFPFIKLFKHTHWAGAGSFYSIYKIIDLLKLNKMHISNIEFDSLGDSIWITSIKKSDQSRQSS